MLRFSDIMTSDIVYFDPAHEAPCREFCLERKIEVLPAATDDFQYVRLEDDGRFVLKALIDPDKFGELVKETQYRINGVLIGRLRGLTAEIVKFDTYPLVTEVVMAQGKKFYPELKSFLRKNSNIQARLVNELGGLYLRNHLGELLSNLYSLLPEKPDQEAWKQLEEAMRKGFQTILIQRITPALTYKSRHDWVDRMRIVHPDERLFQEDVYERFRYSSMLFVMNRGARVGVVHFSDYNQVSVVTDTFSKLHSLERELVTALSGRKIKMEDIARLQEDYPIAPAEWEMLQGRTQGDMQAVLKFHDLSRLYLKTLLRLYNHEIPGEEIAPTPLQDSNLINLLRNRVAHSSDLIDRVDTSRASLIFDFNSFAHFFRQQRALEVALRQITSHNFYMVTNY
ncbi:MAG: hypothetical protein AB8F95_10315 [Bacteroidia bacterium]